MKSHPSQLRRCGFAALLVLGLASCSRAPERDVAALRQDGIVAEVNAGTSALDLRWRFLRPLDQPLDTISADIDGRPLGVPQIKTYPQPGDGSAILFAIDVGDSRRAPEIQKDQALLLEMISRIRAYHTIGIITFAGDAEILPPRWQSPDDLLKDILAITARGDKTDRDGALLKAVIAAGSIRASRRAVFVLTDGHTDATQDDVREVVTAANRYGVAITFITAAASGLRPADSQALLYMALATGGEVIGGDKIVRFLGNPYALLDSGAEVVFPLAGAYRLPWELHPAVHVRLSYGEKSLDLMVPVSLPLASPLQTLDGLAREPALVGLMALVLAFFIGAALVLRRRAPPSAAPAMLAAMPAPPPAAQLEALDGSRVYALDRPVTRIGRDPENDLVLGDRTVSRRHAIVSRTDTGGLLIVNASGSNGVIVNDRQVDRIILGDGDVIRLGDVALRLRLAAPQQASAA